MPCLTGTLERQKNLCPVAAVDDAVISLTRAGQGRERRSIHPTSAPHPGIRAKGLLSLGSSVKPLLLPPPPSVYNSPNLFPVFSFMSGRGFIFSMLRRGQTPCNAVGGPGSEDGGTTILVSGLRCAESHSQTRPAPRRLLQQALQRRHCVDRGPVQPAPTLTTQHNTLPRIQEADFSPLPSAGRGLSSSVVTRMLSLGGGRDTEGGVGERETHTHTFLCTHTHTEKNCCCDGAESCRQEGRREDPYCHCGWGQM